MNLELAVLCSEPDCQEVYDRRRYACPTCASRARYPIAAWLNRAARSVVSASHSRPTSRSVSSIVLVEETS